MTVEATGEIYDDPDDRAIDADPHPVWKRQYPDPDRSDVNRTLGGHVSLGQGIHFCPGAALARMEGRVARQELLTRFPSWDVDEEASEMVHTSTVRGWATMPARAS